MKKTLCKIVAVLVFTCCLMCLLVACQESPVTKSADGLWRYTLNDDGTATLDEYLGAESIVIVPNTIIAGDQVVTVTKLGDAAFMKIDDGTGKWRNRETYAENKTLTKVIVSEGITSVGHMCFYLCSALNEVSLPQSLTSVGDFSFFGCSSLTEITFPKNVNSIGAYSFRACNNLTKVNVLAEEVLPDLGDKAFYLVNEKSSDDDQYYISPNLKFYVPDAALGLYDADKIEKERRETKNNNHRYWSDYIKAGCFPQLQA